MTNEIRVAARGRLNKPNEMLVMVPRTGRLTLVGRKLYNVMLHHSQMKLQLGRMPDASEYFEAPLRALLEPVGTGESDLRALAKKYLVEMQDVTMEWDSPESGAGSEWKRLKLLSEVDFVKKSGETWVRWGLPPTLVQGLADPSRWTSMELAVMAKLTTYAAVALYDICARYRNNPSGVTSRKPTTWWVDALSNSPAPIDQATGLPKRREWRKFKNEFVLAAIEQINQETDLEIAVLEFKQGRAVAEVQFSVRKKSPRVEPISIAPVDHALLERASRAGISDREIDQLLQEWPAATIGQALAKLEQRKQMAGLEEVRSAIGYLRHLLGRKEVEGAAPAAPAEPDRVAPAAARTLPVEWIQSRREEIANAIEALPVEAQRKLLHQVVESLRARGLLTPSIARRASQGDWFSAGVLKAEIVQLYAEQHLGPDWDKQPPVVDGQLSLIAEPEAS